MSRKTLVVAIAAACLLVAAMGCNTPSMSGIQKSLGKGSLYVTSKPGGSRVYVNERLMGRTPLKVAIKAGEYYVKVKRQGYEDAVEWASVTPGKRATVELTMEKE